MNKLIKIIVVVSSYIFAMCSEDKLITNVDEFYKKFDIANRQKNTQELFEKTDPSVLRSIVCEKYYVMSSLENLENSENIITKIYNATSDECDKIKFLIKMKKSVFCKNLLKKQEDSDLYKFFKSDTLKSELIQSFKTPEEFIKLYEKLTDTEDQNEFLELIPEEYKKDFFKSVAMPKEKKFEFYRKEYSSCGPQSRKKFLLSLTSEDQISFKEELALIKENDEKYKDFKEPYSVNFLWIFKDKTNSDYIVPIDRIEHIKEWVKYNKVVLWYDGDLLNNCENALQNTKKYYLRMFVTKI